MSDKVCAECGTPLPEGWKRITCSDECWLKRNRRQCREYRARKQAKEGLEFKGAGRENKGRKGEPGSKGTRLCAGGCGRWINDYRCTACWAKWRKAHGLPVETENESTLGDEWLTM